MVEVAVVILNYNGEEHLKTFLPSVVANSPEADVIVVDNCSTDHSIDYLKGIEGISYKLLDKNYGFTGGYNRAIDQIDYKYTLLLNSDVEVTNGWLKPLIDFMNEHENVAACQPKILAYQNKNHFEYAGASGGFIDQLGYPYCRGRIFDTLEIDNGQYNDTVPIFWATGAAMMVRSELYWKAGGLDEDFFAHMEEIDLCWRFHLMGKQVYCVPSSEVYHLGGGTLSKYNPRKTYFNFRNNLSMIYKNDTSVSLLWKLPAKIILDAMAALKLWKDHSFGHSLAVIRAYKDFLKFIPKNYAKRKAVLKLKKKGTKIIFPINLLPFSYFIEKKQKFSDYSLRK